ncbi:hypothetical protein PanWU01x14_020260 [Parasponia andersonii]|uniref:Uncharacterized protein n=1 Tax=Parasponia andersonii TaxID=3476 RepID=A0A2P5DYK3_PARAD|nr:hypothetical protein PanWU01x14_020260 [Parasponia andersonii]
MENVRFHREDVEPDEIDNIDDLICQARVVIPNDFLVDDDEMSSHGSSPLATSAASGSSSGDDKHDPKEKRVREEMRGYSIEKELRRLKTNRLKVEICEKTGKPIFDHGKIFLNILTKTIRDTIPSSTPT